MGGFALDGTSRAILSGSACLRALEVHCRAESGGRSATWSRMIGMSSEQQNGPHNGGPFSE
jgi:hypothetical protein